MVFFTFGSNQIISNILSFISDTFLSPMFTYHVTGLRSNDQTCYFVINNDSFQILKYVKLYLHFILSFSALNSYLIPTFTLRNIR